MGYSSFDLHCHSNISDGALSPADLVKRAAENNVETLALTDHDSIAGLQEASIAASQCDSPIKLISGIELSCQWQGVGVHLVGLNFDPLSDVILKAVKHQSVLRLQRAETISQRLCKAGLPDIYQEVLDISGSAGPGRPHFAEVLVRHGCVNSFADAFKHYLGAGKTGDVKNIWPSVAEAVQWIIEAGGNAVIAHPRKYKFTVSKLRRLINEFQEAGGEAIEVCVSGQKQGDTGLLADLCIQYGLLGSVGSDFHTPLASWTELGHVPELPASVQPVWSRW